MKKIIISLGLLLSTLFMYPSYYYFIYRYTGEEKIFEIHEGEGFGQINARLANEGIFPSTRFFYHYCKLTKKMGKFKAGEYIIPSRISFGDLIQLLIKGKSNHEIKITIPEGKNIFEIGHILEQHQICSAKEFIQGARNKEILQALKVPYDSLEGFLFPETYFLRPKMRPQTILKLFYKQFLRQTESLLFSESTLKDKFKVIVLASVVEKETGVGAERPTIAGVFFNRLEKKMKLQSDPTTIYGIFEKFDGNLTKKHLQELTPYNTYRIEGLPKGPICNPGRASILAVLQPESHPYLYFVSRNDGTHVFSENYKQHQHAVNKFQKSLLNHSL